MKDLIILLFYLLSTVARLIRSNGRRTLIAENLLLKHQLLVHARTRKRAPRLRTLDRTLFGFWANFLNPRRMARAAILIKPSTLLKFHGALVQKKYRLLFSSRCRAKPGPKGPEPGIIKAVVEMKQRNPRFGCSRIAQQINLAFGIDLNKDCVRRILATHYHPGGGDGGPSWLTAIGHAKDSLWSLDLFRCELILLKSHWVVVVMDQFTRRIIGFGVYCGDIDGPALCRLFKEAISQQNLPNYLSSDNDPLFQYQRWKANLRILEIQEIKSTPHVPLSHPFIERLIGSVRRELLDQVFFWNGEDLKRKLASYQAYYNEHRTHTARDGVPPESSEGNVLIDLAHYKWQTHCRGLCYLPVAA